jgi:competence protein ComEA
MGERTIASVHRHEPLGSAIVQTWIADHVQIAVGVGLALVLAIVAAVWTRPAPAMIEVRPRERLPTPTTMIYVHVAGGVVEPGVLSLPSGSRVFEAIDAAGGRTEDADDSELNLAAPVTDGQKLIIPQRLPPTPTPLPQPVAAAEPDPPLPPPTAAPRPPTPRPAAQSGAAAGARINVNTASQRVLESLPGIGPVTARRIIDHREVNGPFTSVEQMRDLRVINNSVYERIKDLVTVR